MTLKTTENLYSYVKYSFGPPIAWFLNINNQAMKCKICPSYIYAHFDLCGDPPLVLLFREHFDNFVFLWPRSWHSAWNQWQIWGYSGLQVLARDQQFPYTSLIHPILVDLFFVFWWESMVLGTLSQQGGRDPQLTCWMSQPGYLNF